MKKVLICALLSFAWLLVSCGTPADNADVPKGGKEYEGAVWQAFWESASERFGVEYSDYKMAHTTYSFISENTTSDGYISYYYLIQTAYETRNAFGQEVLHKVTARCYYVPDYSKAVHTTYMTHDGEVVFFDEETEDWLLGIGALSSSPASVDNPKLTTIAEDTKKSATTKKKTIVTTTTTATIQTDAPSFTGSTCLDIDSDTGMPASKVTHFTITDDVIVAGRLSGVLGENNLIVRIVCPDGTVDDTLQYYIVNNETINVGTNAEWIGVGNGTAQVILERTGEVLATYSFVVSE